MKLLLILACAALLAGSCAHAPNPVDPGSADVRCELLRVEPVGDDQATATFRVTNEGRSAFTYRGYSTDGPLYACEVLEGGTWQRSPIGWCGTGLAEQSLAPGGSFEFAASLPRDGRAYRFELGETTLRTPEVSAAR